MYIGGSVNAIKSIFLIAEDLKAKVIHFVAPNIVFILAKNRDNYVFAKTNLTIGDSVVIPKTSYKNMHLYLKAAKRGYRKKDSPFYQQRITSAVFTTSKIYFNHSEQLSIETETVSLPLKKIVEFKLEDTLKSSYSLETPAIRMAPILFEEIHSYLLNNKSEYRYQGTNSKPNTIRIQNGELVLHFGQSDEEKPYVPKNQFFAISGEQEQITFEFSDRSLYLLRWISRAANTDEFLLIPRSGYCVSEGYNKDMVAKVRMSHSYYPEKEGVE